MYFESMGSIVCVWAMERTEIGFDRECFLKLIINQPNKGCVGLIIGDFNLVKYLKYGSNFRMRSL